MRAKEGAALAIVLGSQIDKIADLTDAARAEVQTRADSQADTLRQAVAKILGATDAMDPARLAQELALLAVKTDVTEELDRLAAHVAAARAHLTDGAGVGRKLDFLMQEDAWVLDFCGQNGLPPITLQSARAALPGGALPHWT